MPMVPTEFRRRFLLKMGACAAAVLLPWPSRYANAAQVATGNTWQLPGTWVPSTQLTFIPNLGTWLNAHPKVRDAIQWENSSGTLVPYTSWGRSQSALNDAYVKAFRGTSTGLPKVPVNVAPAPFNRTVISSADAWALYLAHVGHSLAVELRGDLPWSVTTMPDNELKVIFNSQKFFAWASDVGGYEFNGKYGGGFSTLAPPDFVYGFLQANTIPNHDKIPAGQASSSVLYDAKAKAMARLMSWCGDKMSHFFNWTDPANLYAHWQYSGCPPVSRIIEGTINASISSTPRHWTAGCFGTSAFLRAVARTMNIAVEIYGLPPISHITPYVPALDAWMSHADELYDSMGAFSDQTVGTGLSFPKSLLFINTATHDAWFSPALTDAQQMANVGRRLREVVVAYIPLGLMVHHLHDIETGASHATGLVAAELADTYSLAQLEAMNLWGKIDGKIALYGGPQVVQALYDEAMLQKEI